MSNRTPVYVYGVIGAGAAVPDRAGIDSQPLRSVAAEGVAAIISDVPGGELSFGREALTAHSDVLESVLEATTVLPMRFGVVMDDEEAVREQFLVPHVDELLAQLERLSGRVELTLRATYEEAPLLREIIAEEPQIRAFQAASKGTYLDQMRLGEMIAAAVEERRRRDADQIMQVLVPLAEDFQLSEARHERMALSASFLIPRETMARFDAAVDEVGRRQHDRMRLRYTGPLPPHSFVTLEQAS